jgi:hypothetical protein
MARQHVRLEGKLGQVATLRLPVKNRTKATEAVGGYTQVQLRPGTRAYLEWAAPGPSPKELAADARAELQIPVELKQARLRPGTYEGTCVIELGQDRQRFSLEIVVHPADAEG